MNFERGSFVTLTGTGEWAGRIGCVLSVAPKNEWRYQLALLPIENETMNIRVKVRANQVVDYAPKEKHAKVQTRR